MLGWFPFLHQGELLYGGCARLEDALQYPGRCALLTELTDGRSVRPTIDLPSHLEVFVRALPSEHSYTADWLIDHHTLWPYYAPFQDQQTQVASRDQLIGHGGTAVRKFIGSRMYGRLLPRVLRYCPACRDADMNQHGEPLWHRLHQAPGVVVCPEHRMFLKGSTVLWRGQSGRQRFIAAADGMPTVPSEELQCEHKSHTVLLDLAIDVAWLLEQPRLVLPVWALRRSYRKAAENLGFEVSGSTPARAALLTAITEHYSPASLSLLKVTDFITDRYWLRNLFTGRTKTGGHPLMHLVLAHFLGLRFQSLAASIGKTWNPASHEAA